MNLDFPIDSIPKHRVNFLAGALRILRDPDAYMTQLINASGQRVYRIVVNDDVPSTPLSCLEDAYCNTALTRSRR